MSDLRLVIFDVDGTLVDSQGLIYQSFVMAYEGQGLTPPARATALRYVGITLDAIFPMLSPELDADVHATLAARYRDAYHEIRSAQGSAATSPFFAGMRDVLDTLRAQDWTLLAVATGKSQRGLDAMIADHGLGSYFQSAQAADLHPSKPHPSMVMTCLAETGVDAGAAVMIGDTTYDMDMGRAAGVKTIGVSWGHHPVDELDADRIVHDVTALIPTIDEVLGVPA